VGKTGRQIQHARRAKSEVRQQKSVLFAITPARLGLQLLRIGALYRTNRLRRNGIIHEVAGNDRIDAQCSSPPPCSPGSAGLSWALMGEASGAGDTGVSKNRIILVASA